MHDAQAVSPIAVDPVAATAARVEQQYRERTPKSRALDAEARHYLPAGSTRTVTQFSPYPVYVSSGKGVRLTDVDGNEYIDLLSNYTSLIHANAHPEICRAVESQLSRGSAFAAPTEIQLRLAEKVCERMPSVERIRFCNSGTEATMAAIRAAKAFTGRNKIIKMEGGYHGSHDAAEISVSPSLNRVGPSESPNAIPECAGIFRGILDDVVIAPFNHIEVARAIIDKYQDDLAAVIVEPIMGSAGMIPGDPEYLQFLRNATQECGALLIFDEVITFRLAYGGAQELYGIRSDLTSFGKILGGGFPVGAVGGRADIMDLFDTPQRVLTHSGTFNGNPVSMTAGFACLELLTRDVLDRINTLGEQLRSAIQRQLVAMNIPACMTGVGSLGQIHFTDKVVRDYRTAATGKKRPLHLLHLSLLNRGVFIAPRGLWCLSTPMRAEDTAQVTAAFADSLMDLNRSAPGLWSRPD